MNIPRPLPSHYPAYYGNYVGLIPGGDVLDILAEQGERTIDLLDTVGDVDARFRYAADKWSLKQVLGHVIDTERLFVYRAMSFARGDSTPLPSMDEDAWEAAAAHDALDLEDLLDEFWLVRAGTLRFFRNLAPDVLENAGVASGHRFTVGATAWVIAGHERHHVGVLRERYLTALR